MSSQAAALVAQAEADVSGLRLAESGAYNLREALNNVVEVAGDLAKAVPFAIGVRARAFVVRGRS